MSPPSDEAAAAAPARRRRSRVRRAVNVLVVLAVAGALTFGAILRYDSTTCQLRRAFAVASWTCGTFKAHSPTEGSGETA